MVFQVLEVLIMQITVYMSLIALCIEYPVILESQPIRFYTNTVFYKESGIQYVYLHGSIAKYAPFHGEPFEFAIEMYVTAGTSVKFRCDTAHVACIFFMDMGIEIDAFYFMMPFSVNVGIAQ